MATPEKKILGDPMVTPGDELLNALLGEKMVWWNTIMNNTLQNYPSVTSVWKYYNDGKQWLFRLLQKKNTIFWVSLIDDSFRTTFYFPQKAESLISQSSLPIGMKDAFMDAKWFGKIRGITVKVNSPEDVENVLTLVSLKLQVK